MADRIFVVEDDPGAARDLTAALEALGYDVPGTAASGEAALEAIGRESPDLVLMDIRLGPGMDGVEAGRRILADFDLPVVFLTGQEDEETLRRVEESASFGYLAKPVRSQGLRIALELALTRHRLEARLRDREERFRLLIENAHDIITVLDVEGRIRYESPSLRSVLGHDPWDLIGTDFFDKVHPEDVSAVREALREALRHPGRELSVEVRHRHADGGWRILDAVGSAFTLNAFARADRDGAKERFVVVNSRDVTLRRRAERALRQSEERYRRLFHGSVAGVFRRTLEGKFLEVNEAYARIFGYPSPEELAGRPVDEVYLEDEDRESFEETLREHGSARNLELALRRRDGSRIWVLESASMVDDPIRGEPVVVGTTVEITERKRLAAALERMAYDDPLTGLANRRALEQEAARILAFAARHGSRAALVYVDLTRFKRINDTLGHSAGDRVLVQVAERLRARARESDIVARVGGDEFAILLAEVEDAEGATTAARRFAEGLEPEHGVEGRAFHVGAQLGVAVYPDHAEDFASLLTAADRAMYRAKERGDLPVVAYRPSEEPTPDPLALEEEFRTAFEERQLTLHYQPILRVRDGGLAGAEALVRWAHPERGLVTAGDFLPRVESRRLLRRLDRWVLGEALRQLAAWDLPARPPWVSVNLSATTLRDPLFTGEVERLVDGEGGGRLVVEVDEGIARHLYRPEAVIERLRKLGIIVALDDFGGGGSALGYLKTFPADILKLGGHFIRDLDRSPEQGTLAEAVIQLGQALGLTIITEDVEREAQDEWVRSSGCDLVQGYYVGRPVPPDELLRTVDAAADGRNGGRWEPGPLADRPPPRAAEG